MIVSLRPLKLTAVSLACWGLLVPAQLVTADPPRPISVANAPWPRLDNASSGIPAQAAAAAKPSIVDVQLADRGRLYGVVVDPQGSPKAGVAVRVGQFERQVAESRTDESGRFSVSGLRGGTYQLAINGSGSVVRAWAPNTAPPGAKQCVLIVTGQGIARGQMPLEDFFASDAFIVWGMVAAVIAIPIAVHNSGKSTPASQ